MDQGANLRKKKKKMKPSRNTHLTTGDDKREPGGHSANCESNKTRSKKAKKHKIERGDASFAEIAPDTNPSISVPKAALPHKKRRSTAGAWSGKGKKQKNPGDDVSFVDVTPDPSISVRTAVSPRKKRSATVDPGDSQPNAAPPLNDSILRVDEGQVEEVSDETLMATNSQSESGGIGLLLSVSPSEDEEMVRPGAIPVPGPGGRGPELWDEETTSQVAQSQNAGDANTTITPPVLLEAELVGIDDRSQILNENRRLREQMGNVTEARVVAVADEPPTTKNCRSRIMERTWTRCLIVVIGTLMIAVAIALGMLLGRGNESLTDSSSSTSGTPSSKTLTPTASPVSPPPSGVSLEPPQSQFPSLNIPPSQSAAPTPFVSEQTPSGSPSQSPTGTRFPSITPSTTFSLSTLPSASIIPSTIPTTSELSPPSVEPSEVPSYSPTNLVTQPPSDLPTPQPPSELPTPAPTRSPSGLPTSSPTTSPPSLRPTTRFKPSLSPTNAPRTASPTMTPTSSTPQVDGLVTCIAVIDEDAGNNIFANVDALWDELREKFPSRPFCLLQPNLPGVPPNPEIPAPPESALYRPPSFDSDANTIYSQVVRNDRGDPDITSDWYSICDLERQRLRGYTQVSLFLGHPGSGFALGDDDGHLGFFDDVPASLELFFATLEAKGFSVVPLGGVNPDDHWITPCLIV